jgi:hypothetical protein
LATLASGLVNADSVAADANSVYFTEGTSSGFVMTIPLGGGNLATLASGQIAPQGTVADGTSVYWITNGTDANRHTDGAVVQVPLAGGATATLASGRIWTMTADTTNVYWIEFTAVTDDSAHLVKMPLGGGSTTVLTSALFDPGGGLVVSAQPLPACLRRCQSCPCILLAPPSPSRRLPVHASAIALGLLFSHRVPRAPLSSKHSRDDRCPLPAGYARASHLRTGSLLHPRL